MDLPLSLPAIAGYFFSITQIQGSLDVWHATENPRQQFNALCFFLFWYEIMVWNLKIIHNNPVPFYRWVNQTGAESEHCRSDILPSLIQVHSGGSSDMRIIPPTCSATRPLEADGETENSEWSRINPQFPLLTIGKPETYNPQWSANGGAEQRLARPLCLRSVRALNQQGLRQVSGPSRTAGVVWVHSAGSPGTMSSLRLTLV